MPSTSLVMEGEEGAWVRVIEETEGGNEWKREETGRRRGNGGEERLGRRMKLMGDEAEKKLLTYNLCVFLQKPLRTQT